MKRELIALLVVLLLLAPILVGVRKLRRRPWDKPGHTPPPDD